MLYGAQTPRRRDAQRNRSAIVAAASEAMTTSRPAVGMSEIARRAGVGQATLYRHFPDRDALTAAVIGYQIERLELLIEAGRDDPTCFRRVLGELLRTQITMRPLVFLVRRMDARARRRFSQRVIAVLASPLRQAQESGLVRGDLVLGDLVLLFSMVEGVLGAAADTAAARRSIDLALDGVFRASITVT
ncbi:MAG TPA: TetR/AcrR family transcriptional regulator [Actinoplanes sp.]